MEEKKIIGYKLKPECEQFRKAAESIAGTFIIKAQVELVTPESISKLDDVGVLGLWFDPVYEFKVDDWVYNEEYGVNQVDEIVRSDVRFRYMFDGNFDCIIKGSHIWNRLVPATQKQIGRFLIEEARRKYPVGSMVKSICCSLTIQVKEGSVFAADHKGDIIFDNAVTVYSREAGEWAEIKDGYRGVMLTNIKELFLADIFSIDEKEFRRLSKVNGLDSVVIRGQRFTKHDIKELSDFFRKNKKKD